MKSFVQKLKNSLEPFYSPSEAEYMAFSVIEKFCSVSKIDILSGKNFEISQAQNKQIQQALARLQNYEPLQYVLGEAFFCGNFFEVNPNVLIPRPETEELVKIVSQTLQAQSPEAKILDIGTGSGCIAISLALTLPKAQITALDVSAEALQVAQRNAKKMNVQLNFMQKDIFSWENEENFIWDCIVSNPPYVCESEKNTMEANVLLYEPATALFVADTNPLLFYEKITTLAQNSLCKGGFLFFEINQKFGNEIANLLSENNFTTIKILKDFYGKDRFAMAQKN
jgi:release factor glutamine methyltransferase